eukprot:9419566-Pyramimonas_sp.AAC.1
MYDECSSAWTCQNNSITEEEARGRMNVFTSLTRDQWELEQSRCKGMRGSTLSDVPGIFGERHELALAANSGTIVYGMLTVLVDIGSNISTMCLKTAQTFERVPCARGHDVKYLNLTKR